MFKRITSWFFLFSLLLGLALNGLTALPARAQSVQDTLNGLSTTAQAIPAFRAQDANASATTYNTNFMASYAGKIIGIILSFIGVIFLGLMIYGGLMWMMAQGNEQQITKAKTLITNAIIGLIVVFAAYALTNFIAQNFLRP